MSAEQLNETLVFEVPCRTQAESLCARLRPRWHVDHYDCGEVVLVAAELRPRADDLAVLLRAVKLWAADSALALRGSTSTADRTCSRPASASSAQPPEAMTTEERATRLLH